MSIKDIEQKALDLLSLREHSRQELTRKLLKRKFELADIDVVLDKLMERKFLSEERFTEAYINSRMKKGYGPLRIEQELQERGVNGAIIGRTFETMDCDWYAQAVDVRRKKFGEGRVDDYKEKAKQMRFLQYRGFDQEQLRYAVEFDYENQ